VTSQQDRQTADIANREVTYFAPIRGEVFRPGFYVAALKGYRIAGPYRSEREAEAALASGVVGMTP
jgi:hypothetical protein